MDINHRHTVWTNSIALGEKERERNRERNRERSKKWNVNNVTMIKQSHRHHDSYKCNY